MNGLVLLALILIIIPTLSQGQGLSFFGGASFTAHEEFGFPTVINNVEVILIRNNNFKADDFEPSFGITGGFTYGLAKKLSLKHSLEHTRILSTFAALDNDQIDPVFGPIIKVGTFKQPYMNQQINLAYELLSVGSVKILLVGGVVNQILIKNRNNYDKIDGTGEENRRAFDMLNSVPKSFKSWQIRYIYGLELKFKSLNINFSQHQYFNKSFSSQIEFEGEKTELETTRRLYRLSLSYDIFKR